MRSPNIDVKEKSSTVLDKLTDTITKIFLKI